jgi:hypothetical protein
MIERELCSFCLLPFANTKFAKGLIKLSEGKRETLEAQAFQLLLATNNTRIDVLTMFDNVYPCQSSPLHSAVMTIPAMIYMKIKMIQNRC